MTQPESVVLRKDLADEMVDHCREGRPNEACGLLAADSGGIVRVIKMTNASASPVRYSLDPQEQFKAYKAMSDLGLELAGVFHSHTHTEAYPSPTDVRLASEDVPYLIVSLASEKPSIRAFRIIKANWMDENGEIEEMPVEVEG
ncbi:MAG: M67 family metallopeptidase [Actinomycetota bacterium]|nr:M67 family metallopeptidase [Actinomycetota bacterium]